MPSACACASPVPPLAPDRSPRSPGAGGTKKGTNGNFRATCGDLRLALGQGLHDRGPDLGQREDAPAEPCPSRGRGPLGETRTLLAAERWCARLA